MNPLRIGGFMQPTPYSGTLCLQATSYWHGPRNIMCSAGSRSLGAGFSPWGLWFSLGRLHVTFAADEVTLQQVSVQSCFSFPLAIVTPLLLYIHSSMTVPWGVRQPSSFGWLQSNRLGAVADPQPWRPEYLGRSDDGNYTARVTTAATCIREDTGCPSCFS
jgi:hypothetical protein